MWVIVRFWEVLVRVAVPIDAVLLADLVELGFRMRIIMLGFRMRITAFD